MKKVCASGAIGLLLTMFIITLLFIFMMPILKSFDKTGPGSNNISKKSVEEHINKELEAIESMRRQTVNVNRNLNQEY